MKTTTTATGKDKVEEAVGKLLDGSMSLRDVEKQMGEGANFGAEARRAYLERKYGKTLDHIGRDSIDFDDAAKRNIENPIGKAQIPMGYAGELKINGAYANGDYPIVLATTEGMLVAGVARGLSVLSKPSPTAIGVTARVVRDGMTRDVLVRAMGSAESAQLTEWINGKAGAGFLEDAFSKNTKHGKLVEIFATPVGRDVHIRFKARTGAAMGMNMVTIAANESVKLMIPEVKERLGIDVDHISESGNMCTDKKAAPINFIMGRGASVIADTHLPRELVAEKFKVTPEAIAALSHSKNFVGTAAAGGTPSCNAHVANMLAGLYIAYGQDVAQIVEGSLAVTNAEVAEDGSLYVSITMPAVEVGTFGGGTSRETQKEALNLLGLYGENDAEGRTRLAFAEIVAGVCLAGELNLLAVQASHTLSSAHGKLRRG